MNLEETIELYSKIATRSGYRVLFQWLYKVYSTAYLPCVNPKYIRSLAENKTKLAIVDVIIDDFADKRGLRNWDMLIKFIELLTNLDKEYNNPYLEIVRIILKDVLESIKSYPRYDEFKTIFMQDLYRVLLSMLYSYNLNKSPYLSNDIENKFYLPAGTMVVLHLDMDLMCCEKFDITELGKIRRISLLVEKVMHIGNMLNTYLREIEEDDLSSEILLLAYLKGIPARPENLQELEPIFIKKAKEYIDQIKELEDKIQSIKLKGFHKKVEDIFNLFLKRVKYWRIPNPK